MTTKELIIKYGKPNVTGEGYLVTINLPYPMKLAWDLDTQIYKMRCHKLVADKFLSSMDLDVTVADNGKIALELYKRNDFDLILMDIQMPEMDGFETTNYIRNKMAKNKVEIPIVAMTAHALNGDEQKCIDAGMNDYISKPIKKKDLIGLLKRVTRALS